MNKWIALFRGINVGGNHILPMADLRAGLESLGLREAKTYIQSGNAVFRSRDEDGVALSGKIADWIEENYHFRPRILILPGDALRRIAAANPFPAGEENPKNLHLYFLAAPAKSADLKAMDALKSDTENYLLTDTAFYLHAPDGVGRSKLATQVERLLGVPATARNWRTISRILELAEELG